MRGGHGAHGRRHARGLRVAEFLGGKHANFNVAIWRRDAATAIPYEIVERMLAAIAPEADALTLFNQPVLWNGVTNPFGRAH